MAFWRKWTREPRLTAREQSLVAEQLRRCRLMVRKHLEQLAEEESLSASQFCAILKAGHPSFSPDPPEHQSVPVPVLDERPPVTADQAAGVLINSVAEHFAAGALDDAMRLPITPFSLRDDREAVTRDLVVATTVIRNQALTNLFSTHVARNLEDWSISTLARRYRTDDVAAFYAELSATWRLALDRCAPPMLDLPKALVSRSCSRLAVRQEDSPIIDILIAELLVEAEWRGWQRARGLWDIQACPLTE